MIQKSVGRAKQASCKEGSDSWVEYIHELTVFIFVVLRALVAAVAELITNAVCRLVFV
jgi:hypothetical protein